jgi:hypothetical protein
MTSSNHYRPDFKDYYSISYSYNEKRSKIEGYEVNDIIGNYYWEETQSSNPKWNIVELWKINKTYNNGDFVVYNNILYKSFLNKIHACLYLYNHCLLILRTLNSFEALPTSPKE